MQPILFYDIPSRLPVKDRAWSPNTWKIRWTLNYKQLSYKTVWVEYPDIEALSLEIGAEPAHKRENGDPYYTLPIIKDPNTDKIISDSHNIALYLDETYPERQVMPKGTAGLFFGFQGFLWEVIEENYNIVVLGVHNILNPRSREYFRRTREADEGKALEELSPTEKRAEQFTSLQKGYNRLARCYEKNGTDGKGKFLMGDQISYGDFIIASWLMWTKPTVTVDEWERVMAYSDGRWKRLLQDLAEYQNVDEGEVYQTKA